MSALRRAACCLAALLAAACDARQSTEEGGAAALARNLSRALSHGHGVEIHVEDPAAAESLARLAAHERARGGPSASVRVRTAGDSQAARIVVGTPRSGLVAALATRAGFALGDDPPRFRVADIDHDAPEDAARFTLEDPERPGLPVTVWLGNDLERLLPQIEDAVPRAVPSFATWRAGEPALAGRLGVRGGLRVREVERVGLARLALRGPAGRVQRVPGFRIESGSELAPAAVEQAARDLAAARQRALSLADDTWPEVDVRLVALAEDFLLAGETNRLGRWNRARSAAEMLVLAGLTDGGAAAVRAGLRGALGPAVVPWIEEGAAVAAARTWFGRDLERVLARIDVYGATRRVARIVDPASDARMPSHVLVPLRAALFDHLRAERGDAFVRALWTGTRALHVDDHLEASFATALASRTARLRGEVRHRSGQRRDLVLAHPPLVGVVLTESGPDVRQGYGSRRAYSALAALRPAGVESVAFRADFVETVLPFGAPAARDLAPVTGDVALFAGLVAARNVGLRTTLSAHLWASDAGICTGGWSRAGEAEWRAYFEGLSAVVEHAGHLANLAGADWLALGADLRGVSAAEPDGRRSPRAESAWRREGWTSVIGAARGAFPGALTYAAADHLEAERIGFWSDLDAVGIELDPRTEPESNWPRLDLAHKLALGLQGAGEIANRFEKPLLVTHVSFAPVLDGRAGLGLEWTDVQLRICAESIRDALAGGIDLRGVWLARAATDPEDRGVNARDPLLAPTEVAERLADLRAAFRAGARSPR